MARTNVRVRIDPIGQMEIVDPGFDLIGLLREISPDFQIQSSTLDDFVSPRFMQLRQSGVDIAHHQLSGLAVERLWQLHTEAMHIWRAGDIQRSSQGSASLMDLKIEISRRLLADCCLCAHRCGVNRLAGQLGVCQLGVDATVGEHFVHIAEESPINPSLVLNLAGCGLRCRFCQQWSLLDVKRVAGEPLMPELWARLDSGSARSLSFVGGNPDESLYAILRFLAACPPKWKLPVVWNCHSYATNVTLELLEGVADVYVPDFKYANESCGQLLSGVTNYPAVAQNAMTMMLRQNVPVIVRILILPGHVQCCHLPTLHWLATLASPHIAVSIRAQYCPDWKITDSDGPLARRATPDEIETVAEMARDLRLSLIS
jgi:putative pyruvate formate lyase activating enzyme